MTLSLFPWKCRKMTNTKQQANKRQRIAEEQEYLCYYCERKMSMSMARQGAKKKATLEHLKRKVDGGTYHYDNIVVACQECNCNRGDYPVEMWRELCTTIIALRRLGKAARKKPGREAHKATKGMEQPIKNNILNLCSRHASKFIIPQIRIKYWQMEEDVVNSYLQEQENGCRDLYIHQRLRNERAGAIT